MGARNRQLQIAAKLCGVSAQHRTNFKKALPWQHFERVFCINLDRRPDRWKFMQSQFAHLRMPVQRWSAVDGNNLNVQNLANVGLVAKAALPRYFLPAQQKLFGTDLTDGAIGCALSHMQIWKEIIECGRGEQSTFLVLEDDCQFLPDFSEEVLAQRLDHVPNDWELIYIGGQDLMHKQHRYEVSTGVRRLYKGFRETTAYVINVAGAKAALEVCVPMHWQFDTQLNDESLRQGFGFGRDHQEYTMKPRGYCLWPPMVFQQRDKFKTDVQTIEHN